MPREAPSSAPALGAGLTFGVVVALFTYGGLRLDEAWGTKPWLVLAGVFVGLVGGTIHLLNTLAPGVLPFGRRKQSREQEPPQNR